MRLDFLRRGRISFFRRSRPVCLLSRNKLSIGRNRFNVSRSRLDFSGNSNSGGDLTAVQRLKLRLRLRLVALVILTLHVHGGVSRSPRLVLSTLVFMTLHRNDSRGNRLDDSGLGVRVLLVIINSRLSIVKFRSGRTHDPHGCFLGFTLLLVTYNGGGNLGFHFLGGGDHAVVTSGSFHNAGDFDSLGGLLTHGTVFVNSGGGEGSYGIRRKNRAQQR